MLHEKEAAILARQMCQLAHKFSPVRCSSFLDVGCATGYSMDVVADIFPDARVAGVDLSPGCVEAARQRQEEVHLASAEALPFTDEEFDWVFCASTLEHCVNMPTAAQELLRVARMGVYISVPLEADNAHFRRKGPDHRWFLSNPLDWLDKFRSPDNRLRLYRARILAPNDFVFVFSSWRLIDLRAPSGEGTI